ncbi:MAG: LytTR family transcriptional regulator, partial [Lachnospiraceae bacterium]|nr:LytTR family transcriptional regulator [Lachnospiraceae bacterium]
THEKEYQVYETITSLCERIGSGFIRVNQGEVVNAELIKEIKGNTIYLKDGKEMTIGRTYRKDVLSRYFGK